MQHEIKAQIASAAKTYLAAKSLSQAELARHADLNPAYLSSILSGNFTVSVSGKPAAIADKWFAQLAKAIGYQPAAVWPLITTIQFQEIIAALEDAKRTGFTKTIIGQSGAGKTYAVDAFVKAHPQHTYRITLSALLKLNDIIALLLDRLGLDHTGRPASRLAKIITKLREIRANGGNPIIILDEAENMEIATIKMLKALYDGVKDYCALVLIGTDQLTNKLQKMKSKNRDAVPQFYRRFRAGIRTLTPVDGRFADFYEKHNVEKGIRKILDRECDNYGELADYLEPALKEAAQRGEPLTENLFRLFHNIPA